MISYNVATKDNVFMNIITSEIPVFPTTPIIGPIYDLEARGKKICCTIT
jgi:hypothetical protein